MLCTAQGSFKSSEFDKESSEELIDHTYSTEESKPGKKTNLTHIFSLVWYITVIKSKTLPNLISAVNLSSPRIICISRKLFNIGCFFSHLCPQ